MIFKRYFKALLVAAITTIGISCQEAAHSDEDNNTEFVPTEQVTIKIEAEADETRTILDIEAQMTHWQEGDKIMVIENGTRYTPSKEALLSDNGRALFEATFATDTTTDTYTYDAIYPAERVSFDGGVSSTSVMVMLATEQHPTATSFDPKADILLAERITCKEQPSLLNMRFKRLVAMGELSLSNMPDGCCIKDVTLRMDDNVVLAGYNRINCAEGEVTEYGCDRESFVLKLIYDTPIEASAPIYFTCNPVTLIEGETFTVEVTTTDGAIYKRSLTIPENRTLEFKQGDLNRFSVDMSDVTIEGGEDDEDNGYTFRRVSKVTSGKAYLIAAEGYIAVPITTKDYDYLQVVDGDTDDDGVITLDNCNNAFIIESTNGGYTIRQAIDNRYLYQYKSYNSFNVDASPSEGKVWSITNSGDSFTIKNTSKNKYIQYSIAYNSFGSYSKAQDQGVLPMLYELEGDIEWDDDENEDDSDTPIVTPSGEWLELPANPDMSKYPNGVTITITDGDERNYTHFYDKSTYTTMWVAYPLESKHMGSYSRPSTWDWNPYISTSDQVNLCNRSYTDSDVHVRGHLIPNASRNGIQNMQIQTFYVTNSVPQVHTNFNSGIWQKLEAALQSLGEQELIYIVTGVAFNKEGENRNVEYTTAKDDTKQVPIPNYFYKVVLKVNTNSSGEVTDASTVGFWFENKAYSGSAYDSYTTTVDQIEAWTGFDFFVNLPDAIETKAEQNSSWSSFKNW